MLPAFLHRTLPDNQNAAVAEHNWFAGLYGDRSYLVVTDEAHAKQKYQDAQFMWVIDARKEDKLIPIATFMPDRKKYFDRPGRFGAHNIPADGRKRSIPSHGGRPLRLMVGKQ